MKSPHKKRIVRSEAANVANQILWELGECGTVSRCEVAGSLRRGAPTCGDIDIVAAASNLDYALVEIKTIFRETAYLKRIVVVPDVGYKLVLGSFREFHIKSEIWVVAPSHYGSTLDWATGSREHVRAIRLWCLVRGFKLPIGNHRIDRSSRLWWLNREAFFCHVFKPAPASDLFESEEELYNRLQLNWIPPGSRRGGLKALWKAHQRWLASRRGVRDRSSSAGRPMPLAVRFPDRRAPVSRADQSA